MLEGGYQAAKELCFEKNEKIVRVALELMGNLSVCESLQLRIFKDQMKQDIILMIQFFALKEEDDSNLDKKLGSVTFLANTIHLDQVKQAILASDSFFETFKTSIPLILQGGYKKRDDIAIRALFVV